MIFLPIPFIKCFLVPAFSVNTMNENRNINEETLVDKLSSGYLSAWEQLARQANEGTIRTYDALRALEKGLNVVIPNYEKAIKDNADVAYWTNQKVIAQKVLRELDNPRINLVEYNGVSLSKK